MKEPRSLLDVTPVMPLITIDHPSRAVAVARAVTSAGIPLVQVALDGPAAYEAIARIASGAPEVIVGAAAVTDADQPALARAAGAEFLVASDGAPALREAMLDTELPHLPGIATVAEAVALLDAGYTDLALASAATAGGLRLLRQLAAFVPAARFCVSGGVTAADLTSYLAASNVGCVAVDWLAPADAVRRRDWERIRRLADVAVKLSTPTVSAAHSSSHGFSSTVRAL